MHCLCSNFLAETTRIAISAKAEPSIIDFERVSCPGVSKKVKMLSWFVKTALAISREQPYFLSSSEMSSKYWSHSSPVSSSSLIYRSLSFCFCAYKMQRFCSAFWIIPLLKRIWPQRVDLPVPEGPITTTRQWLASFDVSTWSSSPFWLFDSWIYPFFLISISL